VLSLHWLKLAPVLVPAMLTLGVAGAIAVRRRRARRAPAAAPAAAPGLRLDPVALRPLARDAVLERLSDPVVVVDLEGRLVDLNPAAAQLLGAGPAAADGAFDPRRLQGWAAVAEALDGAALVRRPGPGATAPGGDLIFEAQVSEVRSPEGALRGRAVLLRNVTAHLRVEAAMAAAQQRLEERVRARTVELGAAPSSRTPSRSRRSSTSTGTCWR